MKILICAWTLFFLVSGFYATAAEYRHVEKEPAPLEKNTHALLKQKFPDAVLTAALETLHELSESPEYLNFLSQRYPNLGPFATFEEFFSKAPPPKKRYFKFFNAQFHVERQEDIRDDEHFAAHAFTSGYWILEAYRRGKDKPPRKGSSLRLATRALVQPTGRKLLERRLGIEYGSRLTDSDWMRIIPTFHPLISLSSEHLNEDIRWMKTLITKYGQTDGFLWIAVHDPILFGRILYTFSSKEALLKCLYDPIDTYLEERKRRGDHNPEF